MNDQHFFSALAQALSADMVSIAAVWLWDSCMRIREHALSLACSLICLLCLPMYFLQNCWACKLQ